MAKQNIHRTVFIGEQTTTVTYIMIEGDRIFVRGRAWWDWFGWFPRWVPVLNNVHELLNHYEERQVLDMDEGRTEQKVRVYFFDLDTLQNYQARMNPAILNRLQSLERERNHLYQLSREVGTYFEGMGMRDAFVERFKREFKFYTEDIKPGWAYNRDSSDKDKKGSKK